MATIYSPMRMDSLVN